MKNAKTEALHKKLGNVVCAECGSKKHKTKEHDEKHEKVEKEKDEE